MLGMEGVFEHIYPTYVVDNLNTTSIQNDLGCHVSCVLASQGEDIRWSDPGMLGVVSLKPFRLNCSLLLSLWMMEVIIVIFVL